MKCFILIFLIFIFSCQENIKDPSIFFETSPEATQIGYPVTHNITINDLGDLYSLDSVEWADSSLWLSDSLKVFIKESQIDTFKNSISINYQITFWDTGTVVIPPLNANISFPDSVSSTIFRTDSSFVYVSTVIDSSMKNIIDDKPLKDIQFPIERLKLFSLFLIIIFILLVAQLIRKRNTKKLLNRNFFNFNPKSKALNDIKKIDLTKNSEEFFFEISELLRKYFQNNFYIISFEMTSSELKEFFKDKDLNKLLNEIDQVKFAKKDPNLAQKKEILVLLKKVIRKLL